MKPSEISLEQKICREQKKGGNTRAYKRKQKGKTEQAGRKETQWQQISKLKDQNRNTICIKIA